MQTTQKEYDALVVTAEDIINSLMDLVENLSEERYSSSNIIAQADDWLKWKNGEMTDQEVSDTFNYTAPAKQCENGFCGSVATTQVSFERGVNRVLKILNVCEYDKKQLIERYSYKAV